MRVFDFHPHYITKFIDNKENFQFIIFNSIDWVDEE